MNDVIKFISVFTSDFTNQEIVDVFSDKCSYWFATILFGRFIRENSTIVFDKEANHFGTRIHGKVYDISGDVTANHKWVPWLDVSNDERKTQIVKTYIMF